MKTKIFYTTNAGLYFCSDSGEILIDGIHDAGSVGFCPMKADMIEQMKTEHGLFARSGALLFTHLHKDHYDESAVSEYIRAHPDTAIWGPGLESRGINTIDETGDMSRFMIGDFSVTACKTRHSGSRTLDVPHYSILLCNESAGEAFLVAGDAVLEPSLADRILCETSEMTAGVCAFVMAYQLAERKSKAFIEALSPSRIFLIHQPGPADGEYDKVARIKSFGIRQTTAGVIVEEPAPMNWIS